MDTTPADGLSGPPAHGLDRSIGTKTALAFAALAMVQLALVWTHVPWMDELQAVLLARETHSLSDWYWNFRYEGHPPLWHLLLKLPLALGFDAETSLKMVLTPFVLATLALIALRSPFAPPWRLFVASNYLFVFEYGVISRSYSMALAMLIAVVAFRQSKFVWLLVPLLPQGGAQFVIIAVGCLWVLWREGHRLWLGNAATAASILIALRWIVPAADFEHVLVPEVAGGFLEALMRTLVRAGALVLPLTTGGLPAPWVELSPGMGSAQLVAGAALPFFCLVALRGRPAFMWAGLAFCLATYAISLFGYTLSMRHFGLIYVCVLLLLWIAVQEGLKPGPLFKVWTMVLAAAGFVTVVQVWHRPFGPVREIAAWVEATGRQDATFVALDPHLGAELTGTLGMPTLDLAQSCLQTFARPRRPAYPTRLRQAAGPDAASSAAGARVLQADIRLAAARAGGRVLTLFDRRWHELVALAPEPDLRLVAHLPGGLDGVKFSRWIYEMRAAPAQPPQPFPDCGQLVAR